MPAAARLGDKSQVDADAHGCPACPHPGVGPIVVGSTDVQWNGLPAARKDDLGIHAACCGPNIFTIAEGSPSVYVNGKPAARMNDECTHCGGDGPIIEGSPDVMLDDGASAEGLGDYLLNVLKMLLDNAANFAKDQLQTIADSHGLGDHVGTQGGAGDGKDDKGKDGDKDKDKGGDLSKDNKDDPPSGSIVSAGWDLKRARNGQEVEIQIACKDPKGKLNVEIWARSSDRTEDKSVQKIDLDASADAKKKVKLDIPSDAAGGNECHFYYVVKDEKGGQKRSGMIYVDRAPFRFST